MRLLVLALLIACKGGPEKAFIVGFRALDEGGAVIVWQANYEDKRSASWTTRIDANGNELWTRKVPEDAMSVGGSGAVTIVDGAAIVRYGTYSKAQNATTGNSAIAFDLEDGKTLWDKEVAKYVPYAFDGDRMSSLHGLPLWVSDIAVGKHLVSFSDTGKEDTVVGVVARTGAIAWQAPSNELRYGPAVFGGSYALHAVGDVAITNAATGESTSLSGPGVGCVLDGEYIVVEGQETRLVGLRDGARRVIADPFTAIGKASVDSCGRYKDRYVFRVHSYTPNNYAVVITDARGALLHEIALAGMPVMDDLQKSDPAHAYFSGELPRFVPYPSYEPSVLEMVDLETGTVAWRSKPDDRLLHGSLFHRGTRWVWQRKIEDTLVIIDGTTGRLIGATDTYSYRGIYPISGNVSRATTNDTLWVYSGDWTTADKAPVVALDLATLKPRFPPRIVKLTDATARVREQLGIP